MDPENQILSAIIKLNDNAKAYMDKANKDIAFMSSEYMKIIPNLLLTLGHSLVGKEINVGSGYSATIKDVPFMEQIDDFSCWVKIPVDVRDSPRIYHLITAISVGTLSRPILEELQEAKWRLTTPQDTYVTNDDISLNN